MVATRVHRSPTPNPDVIVEKNHPGEFLISLLDEHYCHENEAVSGGVGGVAHNTVLANGDGTFRGIVYEGVAAGETRPRALLKRGAEVSLARLVFPTAPDGADAGSDNVAETAALRTALIAGMRAANPPILVRD